LLVDTSVWVDHLRRGNAALAELLGQGAVWTHQFVIGELACGPLTQRKELLSSLAALPHAPLVAHEEVFAYVDARRLMGRGLGWVDTHLLAAATLAKIPFWTLDKPLARVATEIGLELRD
jgi:predicted nucleic acid-binding protein